MQSSSHADSIAWSIWIEIGLTFTGIEAAAAVVIATASVAMLAVIGGGIVGVDELVSLGGINALVIPGG
jgi:hypothetical protein